MLTLFLMTAQVAVAVVFASAFAGKVRNSRSRRAFAESLTETGLIPRWLATPVTTAILASELVLPFLIIWPGTRLLGLVGSLVLSSTFLIGVTAVVLRGKSASCQCFGTTAMPFGWRHVVRNAILVAIVGGGLLLLLPDKGMSSDLGMAIPGATAGVFLGLLLVTFDQIVELFAPARVRGAAT